MNLLSIQVRDFRSACAFQALRLKWNTNTCRRDARTAFQKPNRDRIFGMFSNCGLRGLLESGWRNHAMAFKQE
jgi:hypothetical protein